MAKRIYYRTKRKRNRSFSRKAISSMLAFILIFQTVIGVFAPVNFSLEPPYIETQEVSAAGESWYSANGTWSYRKEITINNIKVSDLDSADMLNFPITVNSTDLDLRTVTNGGKVENGNGYDIIFTDSTGSGTKLDHEIEKYDAVAGELVTHVRIPVLDYDDNTILYMYYGNDAITVSQENITAVWDSNFVMVQHLQEDPGPGGAGEIVDSTQYNNDGTAEASMLTEDQVAGQIDGSLDFDGVDDYVDCGTGIGSDVTQNITVSLLIKGSAQENVGLIAKRVTGADYSYAFRTSSINPYNKATFIIKNSDDVQVNLESTQIFFDGTDKFLVGTYDGTNMKLYYNGTFDVSASQTGNLKSTADPLVIGKYITNHFNGIIDEVRISNVSRSAGWITTEYNNQSDVGSFLNFSTEEALGTLTLANHTTDQETNAFTTNGGTTDLELASFKLTNANENISVSNLEFTLSGASGLSNSDWSNIEIVVDDNNDGNIAVGETTTVGGAGVVDMTANTISFSTSFTVSAETNYILRADIDPLDLNDKVDIDLTTGNITATGVNSSVTITPTGSMTQANHSKSWYNNAWSYRKAITIDRAEVAENLTNFPVLVSTTDTDLISKTRSDGYDIVFTNFDGTKIDYEIEKFVSGTGELVAWVKTNLSTSTNAVLYMYYGNADATDQQNATGVWDDNFVMVQHLQETPNGTADEMIDSAGVNHGTTVNMDNIDQVAGQIDGSLDFDGSTEYITVAQAPFQKIYDGTEPFTISAIGKVGTKGSSSLNYICGFRIGGGDLVYVYYWDNYGTITFGISMSDGYVKNGLTITVPNLEDKTAWYLVSWDGTSSITVTVIDDTGTVYTDTKAITQADFPDGTICTATLAARYANSYPWKGMLDEIRVSNTVRSAGWIETEYNNQSDIEAFLDFSSELVNNTTPTATAPTASQATDGTGYVTIQTIIDDADNDNTLKFKTEYSLDDGSTWTSGDPYLTSFITTSPDQATEPDVTNTEEYQVGMPTNKIITSAGANTVTIKWDTQSASNGTGAIGTSTPETIVKLRITPFDGITAGTPVVSVSAFTVDNSAPTSGSIQINSNEIYATSSTTTLTLSATGANEMKFSNNGSDYSAYESYGVSKEWDITNATYGGTSSDGAKTVSVIYKDSLGNEAVATSDNITYDATDPTGTVLSFGTIAADSIIAEVSGATDALSGLATSPYYFENTTVPANSDWQAGTSWSSGSLNQNVQYTFKVISKDQAGNTQETVTQNKYTLANVPSAPTVDNATTTSLDVTIDQNLNPANTVYAIYETSTGKYLDSTDGSLDLDSEDWQNYATWGGASGITATPLSENTAYLFQVKARNGDSVETAFGSSTGGTTDSSTPSNPSVATLSEITATAMKLTWTDNSSNEDGFKIEKSTDGVSYSQIGTVVANVLEYTGAGIIFLDPNTQYWFRVRAYNASGNSGYSTASKKYTLANIPTSLSLTADSQTQITANYLANSNPAGTEYYCENTTAGTNSGWITNLTWVSANLTCGTEYSFKIRSRNADNAETAFTDIASVETSACSSGGGLPPAASNTPEIPETTPENPTGEFSVLINNDDEYTNSETVSLKLTAGNDTVRMAISDNEDFENASIIPYQEEIEWEIADGRDEALPRLYGEYTIYAKFYTQYGVASEIISDSIIFKIVTEEEQEEQIEIDIPAEEPTEIEPDEPIKIDDKPEPYQPEIIEPIEPIKPIEPDEPTIIDEIVDEIIDILKPKPESEPEPEIKIEDLVAKETPISMKGKWNLLPQEQINEFVLAPLPKGLERLVQKFPELKNTFEEVGVSKITDLQKLRNSSLSLPGLEKSLRLEEKDLALVKDLPLSEFPQEIKNKIPTEIIFAQIGGEKNIKSVDFDIKLSINDQGEVQQQIRAISGKKLFLTVKPESKAKSVYGYLAFKGYKKGDGSIVSAELWNQTANSFTNLINSFVFANPVFAQDYDNIEEKFITQKFAYADEDGDGIWTAEIYAPIVEGEYEVITLIEYEDPELGTRMIKLTTVVDPEGYVYERIKNQELRITEAIVSIYQLNSQSNEYELWQAGDYQQKNPQTTDKTGRYSFLVPEGTYYITAESDGYSSYKSDPFVVQEGAGVHQNIELKAKGGWLKAFDWKVVAIILLFILVVWNFWRDRNRIKN